MERKVVWSARSTKGVNDITPIVLDSGEVTLPEEILAQFDNHEIELVADASDPVAKFVVQACYSNRPEMVEESQQ